MTSDILLRWLERQAQLGTLTFKPTPELMADISGLAAEIDTEKAVPTHPLLKLIDDHILRPHADGLVESVAFVTLDPSGEMNARVFCPRRLVTMIGALEELRHTMQMERFAKRMQAAQQLAAVGGRKQ